MIDIKKILFEICENELVNDDNIDLVESGILDSYAFIELFSRLEDHDIYLQPTRIDRSKLHTVKGIQELIDEYLKNK